MAQKLISVLCALLVGGCVFSGAVSQGGPAVAATPPSSADAVAVVIGERTYSSPQVPTVEYALHDADAVDRYLVDVLGYQQANIIDLRDATLAQMEAVLGNSRTAEGRLWQIVKPGRSDVTVYFSGHGAPGQQDHQGYLLPVDGDAEKPAINGYPIEQLIDNLARLGTRTTTVYLDACFSGETPRGSLLRSASAIRIVPKQPVVPPGMTVISAGQADQVASWDSHTHHGLFTETLLDGLYGKADQLPYGNGDGKVTVGEIKAYLDDVMTLAARRDFGRTQVASVFGDESRVLVSLPGGRPIARIDVPDSEASPPKAAEAQPAAPPSAPAAPTSPPPRQAERRAPPSAYAACRDMEEGDRVQIETPRGPIPGICVGSADGLVARPLRRRQLAGHRPPSRAFAACRDMAEGDRVQVETPEGMAEATCVRTPEGRLAARPDRRLGNEPASAPQAAPAAREAPSPQSDALYWESIKDSRKVSDYQGYLRQFPSGTFAAVAQSRIDDLTRPPPTPPQQVMAPAVAPVVMPPAPPPPGSVLFASVSSAQTSCPGDTVVWVNTATEVYHYPGTRWYGRTKDGAYMCESQRGVIGARPARNHQ